jgi:hypothetical protein
LEELVEKKVIKIVAKSTTDPTKHYVLLWHATVTYCDISLWHA